MRMNLTVPIETSHILAKNIISGIITKANNSDEKNVGSISVILFIVIILGEDKDDLISKRRIKLQYWAISSVNFQNTSILFRCDLDIHQI